MLFLYVPGVERAEPESRPVSTVCGRVLSPSLFVLPAFCVLRCALSQRGTVDGDLMWKTACSFALDRNK